MARKHHKAVEKGAGGAPIGAVVLPQKRVLNTLSCGTPMLMGGHIEPIHTDVHAITPEANKSHLR